MKAVELKKLTKDELMQKITESEKDLGELKFKHSLNHLENPMSIRNLRRDIARMKTVLDNL